MQPYFGQVTNGVLKIFGRKNFDKELLEFEGKHVEIKIERKKKKRSGSQNAYLHGVLIPEFRKALNEVGYDEIRTNEQAKDLIKALFLQCDVINEKTGEVLKTFKNTSELSTTEIMTLVDDVINYAAKNLNYTIYLPNEQSEFFG
jgi:3-isopropylmalate dehydratase small subunit